MVAPLFSARFSARHLAALLPLLLLTTPACSSKSGGGGGSNDDTSALGPDSGAGCDSHVTGRCAYSDGTCAEYSGDITPPGIASDDPSECQDFGGTYSVAVCSRTGVLGSCVSPAGNNDNVEGSGLVCESYITTWLPSGYDAGAAGAPCIFVTGGGTFVAGP